MPQEDKTTTIIGADGVEYVISGGKIREKCQHRTTTDKSSGKERWIVCAGCGKTIIYNKDTTAPSEMETFSANFRSMHGRNPNGTELSAMM